MTEDIINAMKELIRCYEKCNDPDSGHAREITFWREKFLSSASLPKDPKKGAFIWEGFISTPSEDFMIYTPEEHLANLIRIADENKPT